MSKMRSLARRSACAAALLCMAVVGCVSEDADPDGAGTGGMGTAATGGADPGTGGADPGTGGTGGGSGGSDPGTGGSSASVPACEMGKTTLTAESPLITDFEAAQAFDTPYSFGTPSVMGGTYAYNDLGATDPGELLTIDAGYDATSAAALHGSIPVETWGGGVGLWFGCVDASAFDGISLWIRGSLPSGTADVQLTVLETISDAEGGPCPEGACNSPYVTIDVTDEWTQHMLPWSMFTAGTAGDAEVPATGDNLSGININLGNDNMPNTLEIAVDDVSFIIE